MQVSYGTTDPSLLKKERYPLLFSTIPSDQFLNVGRLHLLEMFGWSRCGVVFSQDRVYAKVSTESLCRECVVKYNYTA